MATIKSFTSLEQSKTLSKILPPESADMWYSIVDNESFICFERHYEYEQIPCWSLAALLSLLDFPCLTQKNENEWEVCVFDHDNYIERTASNPVDACVAMIERLHELNLL